MADPSIMEALSALTVSELQQELKKRGLKRSGAKAILIERLAEDIQKSSQSNAENVENSSELEVIGGASPVKQVNEIRDPHPYMEKYENQLVGNADSACIDSYVEDSTDATQRLVKHRNFLDVEDQSSENLTSSAALPNSLEELVVDSLTHQEVLDADSRGIEKSPRESESEHLHGETDDSYDDARNLAEKLTEPIHGILCDSERIVQIEEVNGGDKVQIVAPEFEEASRDYDEAGYNEDSVEKVTIYHDDTDGDRGNEDAGLDSNLDKANRDDGDEAGDPLDYDEEVDHMQTAVALVSDRSGLEPDEDASSMDHGEREVVIDYDEGVSEKLLRVEQKEDKKDFLKPVTPVSLKKRVASTAATEETQDERFAKRKRRWGSAASNEQSVTISSESIKKLLPDVKIDTMVMQSLPELDYQEGEDADEFVNEQKLSEANSLSIREEDDPKPGSAKSRRVKVDAAKKFTMEAADEDQGVGLKEETGKSV